MTAAQESLQSGLGQRIGWRERKLGITQVLAPIFHEDGDMVSVFLDTRAASDRTRITDAGLTLMKLSYTFDIDTENKERLLRRIISENGIELQDGELFLDTTVAELPVAFLRFTQTVAKVSALQLLRRQLVNSLFYDQLNRFVTEDLRQFRPEVKVAPIASRPELEADYVFQLANRPVYLYGVKDSSKARLSVISCLEFKRENLNFRSLIVHDNVDNLSKKDSRILMNTVDKQYASLPDFQQDAEQFLAREQAA